MRPILQTDEAVWRRRYRWAGWAYLLLAVAVVVLTVASPGLARPERRADIAHLLAGLPFIALFALLVLRGDRLTALLARAVGRAPERARAVGRHVQEKLTMLLTLSALGRTAVFAANAAGLRPRLSAAAPWLSFESVAARPLLMGAAALLMAVLVVLLARASWGPFLRRRSAPS